MVLLHCPGRNIVEGYGIVAQSSHAFILLQKLFFSNFQMLKCKLGCAVKSLTKLAMEESESGQMVKRKPCH